MALLHRSCLRRSFWHQIILWEDYGILRNTEFIIVHPYGVYAGSFYNFHRVSIISPAGTKRDLIWFEIIWFISVFNSC
jgi:hypothetical protein